jgi:hypothetical protein
MESLPRKSDDEMDTDYIKVQAMTMGISLELHIKPYDKVEAFA